MDEYGHKKFSSRRLYKFISKTLKHDSISLKKADNRFCTYIKFNDDIAAVMFGFEYTNHSRVIIPRLAINKKYSFYSPGNILICETIKYLIENTSIRNLDLSRGNEAYKYSMGGIEYSTKSFSI